MKISNCAPNFDWVPLPLHIILLVFYYLYAIFSFLNNKLKITLYKTENGKMQPLFFYYVYAALWRFDMHDILLDCQLLLLWFLVSSTATTNYYFAWNYTLWKISKRQLFFPPISLFFLLMTTPNSFSRWHRADLWLVKTLSKLSMFNCVHCLQYLNRQVPSIIHQKQSILVQDITT